MAINNFKISYIGDKFGVGNDCSYIDKNGKLNIYNPNTEKSKVFLEPEKGVEQVDKIISDSESDLIRTSTFKEMLFSCGLSNLFYDNCFMKDENKIDIIKISGTKDGMQYSNINNTQYNISKEFIDDNLRRLFNAKKRLALSLKRLENKNIIKTKEYLRTPIIGFLKWDSLGDIVGSGTPYDKENIYIDGELINGVNICKKKDEYQYQEFKRPKIREFGKDDVLLIKISFGDDNDIQYKDFYYVYGTECTLSIMSKYKINMDKNGLSIEKLDPNDTNWVAVHSVKKLYNNGEI